jgi:hypothetical protein
VKVYAKDGTLAINPATGVTVESTDIADDSGTFCPSPMAGQDWTAVVQDMPASLGPILVTVEDLTVAVSQLSP